MPEVSRPRLILLVRAWPELAAAYAGSDPRAVREVLARRISDTLERRAAPRDNAATRFQVVSLPSNVPRPDGERQILVNKLVVLGLTPENSRAATDLAEIVPEAFGTEASIGIDLPISPAGGALVQHWCPDDAGQPTFGRQAQALRLIAAEAEAVRELRGEAPANLVMVDTGIPPELLPPPGQMRGWPVLINPLGPLPHQYRKPGEPLTPHGRMVARNALAVATGGVRVLDCPVIPDGITNLLVFLSSVVVAFIEVQASILEARLEEKKRELPPSAWVLCNAWGAFDPSPELHLPLLLRYSDNPNHPVQTLLRLLEATGADIVFATGNCGPYCPNSRCHPSYTGPGAGINGANALSEVLSVGAVRVDRIWLGYSGQGPGIPNMEAEKPDLCAPSHFADDDSATTNTGTSAACGLAAGAVALLRTRWNPGKVDPKALRTALRKAATLPDGVTAWDSRLGHGVLNLAATPGHLPPP